MPFKPDVTVAADGSARVWDVTRDAPLHSLPHPVPLRSVACSPTGAKAHVAVTGADDVPDAATEGKVAFGAGCAAVMV